jgi:hypothetical protein
MFAPSIHEPHPLRVCHFATKEYRLTQLVVMRPLDELHLGNQHRFEPMAALHNRRRDPKAPSAFALFGQVYEGARRHRELLKLSVKVRQSFLRKASPNSAGEYQPIRPW